MLCRAPSGQMSREADGEDSEDPYHRMPWCVWISGLVVTTQHNQQSQQRRTQQIHSAVQQTR